METGMDLMDYKQAVCLPAEDSNMDFFKTMQTRDWVIAAVAFLIGAIIF